MANNVEEMEAFYKALLAALYFERYDVLNYENVDEFYAYLGYNLELTWYVERFICSTSNLLKIIEKEVDGEVARVVNRGPMVVDDEDLPF